MKKNIMLTLIIIVQLFSCSTDEDSTNTDLIGTNITARTISLVKDMNSSTDAIEDEYKNVLYCHFDETIGFDEVVIRDANAFAELVEIIRTKGICSSEDIPQIDFTKHTLLGKYVGGGGCHLALDNKVYEDSVNKTITYLIKPKFSGSCMMYLYSWNWMLVPRLEAEYTVKFQIENQN